MHRAAKKTPVEALLSLDSGLKSFDIQLDNFIAPFPEDPLTMDAETLRQYALQQLRCVVFLADREGSQNLVFVRQTLLPRLIHCYTLSVGLNNDSPTSSPFDKSVELI